MADNILLLDMGNTRLRSAQLKGGTLVVGEDLVHLGQLDIEKLAQLALDIPPDHIVAACVAGNDSELLLREWAEKYLNSDIEFVAAAQEQHGIINAYTNPVQLGSDRWSAMIAAHQQWQGNLCVIDAGTALTLDLIQKNGRHLGGYILPGLNMMQHCLLDGTEIPVTASSVMLADNTRLGDGTVNCIANGALQAACGLIERTIRQYQKQNQDSVQCIITGGDSQTLADNLTVPCIVESNLVLKGLAYIASNRNASI